MPTARDSQAGYTLAAGQPVIVENLATETRFVGAPGCCEHSAAVSGISIPIAGRDGRAYGVLTAHTTSRRKFSEYDVSFLSAVANVVAGAIQRLQLDRRQELMIRELRHRSGNLFSQLLALFSQTAKNSKNVAELVTKYEARVLAMANAHRLVTEGGWKSASLAEVLNTLLAAHLDRISFRPHVFLEPDPTFGLSMAVHELLSNASKHGSLSTRPGIVAVQWDVDRTDRGLTLIFDWKEREGPAPKKGPSRRIRLQADQHGDRAPAQRRGAAEFQRARLRRQARRSADPRALARRRRPEAVLPEDLGVTRANASRLECRRANYALRTS